MSIGGKFLLAIVFLVLQAVATVNHLGAIPIGLAAAGFVVFLFGAIIDIGKKITPRVRRSTRKMAVSGKDSISSITQLKEKRITDLENRFFQIAGEEIANNVQDKGLWYKALAIAEGDKAKQEATYIRLRAKQLFNEELIATNTESKAAQHKPQRQKRDRSSFIEKYHWGRVLVLMLFVSFVIWAAIWDRNNPASEPELVRDFYPNALKVFSEWELRTQTDSNSFSIPSGSRYFISVGVFESANDALQMKSNLGLLGITGSVEAVTFTNSQWWLVTIGPMDGPIYTYWVFEKLLSNDIEAVAFIQ